MNAPHPLPAITTLAQHFIDNRWIAPAPGATLPMIELAGVGHPNSAGRRMRGAFPQRIARWALLRC